MLCTGIVRYMLGATQYLAVAAHVEECALADAMGAPRPESPMPEVVE
jgi:hypothetical protein